MSADDPFETLARSILEGADVDWDVVETDARENGGAGRIQALRELARIVAFNRGLQREAADALVADRSDPDPLDVSTPELPEGAEGST